MAKDLSLTGVERFFDDNEIIVSKTDLKGRMTYVNDVFLRLADYTEQECLGEPHSKIRNPNMPRCIFKLLWDVIQDGRELFAYVVNRSANGDHYWVLAHVTPSKDTQGNVIGYHSNRRVPDRNILEETIMPLYTQLLAEEQKYPNSKDGMAASMAMVTGLLKESGKEYDEFIAGLI
ncbi:MAG TPA: PAS domain-containing protein [Rhodospirillales bacterium]|nr:PAS domain-containing protein [Rhodospirillales bacterium]